MTQGQQQLGRLQLAKVVANEGKEGGEEDSGSHQGDQLSLPWRNLR